MRFAKVKLIISREIASLKTIDYVLVNCNLSTGLWLDHNPQNEIHTKIRKTDGCHR